MITTVNGKKAVVKFVYNGDVTACAIADLENKEVLALEFVRRHSTDQNNRIVARKAALTKTIKGFSRDARRQIWDDISKQMKIV